MNDLRNHINNALSGAGGMLKGLLGTPAQPSTDNTAGLAKSSPTYDIGQRGNKIRAGEAIPVVYGRHVIYGDLIQQPFKDTVSSVTWHNQLMCLGQGYCDVESIRIGSTPIGDLGANATYQVVEPGDEITLFGGAGSTLSTPNAAFDSPTLADGSPGAWTTAFVTCPTGYDTTKLDFSFSLPSGLGTEAGLIFGHVPNTTIRVEVREIDTENEPIGSWVAFGTATRTSLVDPGAVIVISASVTPGRYEIRARRENTGINNAGAIIFSGWIAHVTPLVATYPGVTLLAVRAKTANVTDAQILKINATVFRKVRTWHPDTGFSAIVGTHSAVWAMVDLLTNTTYGGRLDDSRLDLAGLYALHLELLARGDEFDGVFDRKITLWEAFKLICRAVRCTPVLNGGKVTVVRDREQTVPVLMFTPRNIVRDSFSISYAMASEDDADGITIEYMDGIAWIPSEVTVSADGVTAPERPARVKLFGVTGAGQARREGLYLARNNAYRRKMITLRTEAEGLIPNFGDLVSISHDVPQWGVSGDVVSVASGEIILSDLTGINDVGTHYIAFRDQYGALSGPWEIEPGGEPGGVVLVGTWTIATVGSVTTCTSGSDVIRLYTGASEERTHYAMGIGTTWQQLAIVKSIRPRGNFEVELSLLSEDSRVHDD
jgi:hypothetical protein